MGFIESAAIGALLGGLALTGVGAVIGVTAAGPVAGGAFAAAQSAGWMSVAGVGSAMAGIQSAIMVGGTTISATGAAIGGALGGIMAIF